MAEPIGDNTNPYTGSRTGGATGQVGYGAGQPSAYAVQQGMGGAAGTVPNQTAGTSSPSALSMQQQAYLAGIRNYAGTPEQNAAIAQWRAQQEASQQNALAEQAQARWQNPTAMLPGSSPNVLGSSADGRHTVAYAPTPARLADEAFRLQEFQRLNQGLNQFSGTVSTRGDQSNAAQSRDMLLSSLTAGGPSAAELQLRAGQEAANRQGLALARSGRGMGGAGALRLAMQQGQEGMGAANQQAGILRAQESAQRTGQLAALNQMDRASLAGADQTQLATFGARQSLGQAQQQAMADQQKTQLAADTGTNIQNASFANYRDPPKDNSGAIAGAIAGTLGAAATALSDERVKTDITPLDGPGGYNSEAYANAMTGAGRIQGGSAQGPTGGSYTPEPGALARIAAGAAPLADAVSRGIAYDNSQVQQRPQPAMLYNPLQLSDENSKTEIANLREEKRGLLSMIAEMAADNPEVRAAKEREGRAMNAAGKGAAQGLASVGALPKNPATEAFAQTPGYSYQYKPGEGEDPSKRHVGPMAQDLERTAAASAVQTMPDGRKAIDTGRLALVNASATGDIARRLEALESGALDRDAVVAARRPRLSSVGAR